MTNATQITQRYDYDAAVSADIRRWLANDEIPAFNDENDKWEYINDIAYTPSTNIITAGEKYDNDRVRDWVGANLELLSEAIRERDGDYDNHDFVRYVSFGDWHSIDLIMREHVFFQVIEQILDDYIAQ